MAERSPDELRAVWQRVRGRYNLRRPNSAGPASPSEIDAAEQTLGLYYLGLLPTAQELSIAFPSDLRAFYEVLGPERHVSGSFGSGVYGFNWYSLGAVLDVTGYWNEIMWEEYRPEMGLWACLAHWSDKHDIWICCERGHPSFGVVIDCHDGHPWVDAEDVMANSLTDFVETWASWADD